MSALDQLLAYNFEADQEFERGLQSLFTRTDVDQSEKEQLIVKAKLFFFAKKTGLTVTMEDYLNSQKKDAPSVGLDTESAPKELSFAEIKYLIENNKADLIPNNKTIPDILNEPPTSPSIAKPRRKPWEPTEESSDSAIISPHEAGGR